MTELSKNAKDVTGEILDRVFSKKHGYEKSIKKVMKDGKMYHIEFSDGYTAFGEKSRWARRLPEVQWYSRIATEEKELGKTKEQYLEEFKKNKIWFENNEIPEFIDTIRVVNQRNKTK